MAHGTPLGVGDNDERYGAQGAFLIEAGISSSYHIANFFGLTEWIHQPRVTSRAVDGEAATATTADTARKNPAASPPSAPDLKKVLRPLATLNHDPRPAAPPKRPGIDVGAVITRALTAAGLIK